MAGPVVNPTRSETISGQYQYPIVAVKAMSAYQPKDYQFSLTERTLFDKKAIPQGTPVLNGDLGEDAAQHAARAYVQQLQSEAAHKKHSMVSNLRCEVDVTDGELLHVPVWYFQFEHKGRSPWSSSTPTRGASSRRSDRSPLPEDLSFGPVATYRVWPETVRASNLSPLSRSSVEWCIAASVPAGSARSSRLP